jgi:glycosyltransferase involved in cell wall biosynthesis
MVAATAPLRLALVSETFPPEVNGVAMTLGRLTLGLRRRGHRVTVVRPRCPPDYAHGCPLPLDPHDEIHRPGVPLPRYPTMRMGVPSLAALRASWRREPPQVVHVATEGPLGVSAIRAAADLGIPCTSTFHTNFHDYAADYGWPCLEGAIFRYLRWVHNRCACTLVPTAAQAQELQRRGFQRVEVLSRGIDTALFRPDRRSAALRARWGASDSSLVCMTVGRLAAEKNLDLTLRAFQAIRARRPDSRLVLVGDGPERPRLEAAPGVILAGTRCGEDLAAHYASGDLFLFPSMSETYGNVLVEAMASGQAVLGFAYAAAAELVNADQDGVVVPLGDAEAFVAAACRLADDPLLTGRLGAAAVAVGGRRSWERVLDRFTHHLRQAAERQTT